MWKWVGEFELRISISWISRIFSSREPLALVVESPHKVLLALKSPRITNGVGSWLMRLVMSELEMGIWGRYREHTVYHFPSQTLKATACRVVLRLILLV